MPDLLKALIDDRIETFICWIDFSDPRMSSQKTDLNTDIMLFLLFFGHN